MEKNVKAIEMIPNQQLVISSKNGDTKDIIIYSQDFFDIELRFTDKIEINLISKPRVKKIIYG